MRKEELKNLKRINATPRMAELAKDNTEKIKLLVRCQTRGKYLMVCVFLREDLKAGRRTPTYEIYCNPEGDEFITRILIEGQAEKWSKAMADNIGRIGNTIWGYKWDEERKKRIWQNPEGKKTIQKFLGTKEKGIFGLIEWQRRARDKKIREAEARQQAPWDKDMKLVPEVLPSFKDWMKKEGPAKYFIFYEYSRKGATEGYCSHCGKQVPVKKPGHNKKGRCPKCGKAITYKAASRIQTLSTDYYEGQIIQKIKGGVVIRKFEQRQWYRNTDYRKPKSNMKEIERILLLENGITKRYYYGLYKNKVNRWIEDKNYEPYISRYYHPTIKLYKRNLASLKKTALKNSAIDLWDILPTDAAKYLTVENGNPAVEKLARIGMFGLARELMELMYEVKLLDQNATELARMLKIDKARLKRLKAMDGRLAHLKWFQHEKTANTVWPDGMIKDFGDNGFSPSVDFGFLNPPLSYVKIWNYLKKQQELSKKHMSWLKNTWNDYLNMAKKAKMNVKSEMIFKPKNLVEAHNEVVMILQSGEMEKEAKKLEKKWPKVNGIVPRLLKFEYSDGKFSILAPKGILDIVKEGRALQHCVHTCDFYFDRIQKDESYLFFLRRTACPDVPWYTLEVEPSGNIRQKRTTGDNQDKDLEEAVEFLKKWQKVFKKRMTEEEKQLGVIADQARQMEYEKLRRDGNRVWHGKLAGQLLADVLEKDFMEAI